jgi:hypothetical protein
VASNRLPFAFTQHELGFLVPPLDSPPAAEATNASIYLTHHELTGGAAIREADLAERLRKLSAADCLWAIAHLNTRLFAATRPEGSAQLQRRLVQEVVGDVELGRALLQTLTRRGATSVFCEQQLVHLARLVILHADGRPHDDFGGGRLREEWLTCLIGVSDLLDAGLDVKDHDQRLAWEIRQCALNYHEDQLPVTAIHHEVYRVLWPELKDARSEEVEEAFRRHTRMAIADYFTVGAAVLARLVIRGSNEDGLPGIEPARYFSSAQMDQSTWQAFFALTARDADGLRAELVTEAEEYGETTYSSLTFERFPLIEIEPGTFLPLSMASLQRRISQGVFHLLSEAAESEGHDRRRYSSNFGHAFQKSVERTLRRGVAFGPSPVAITADVKYGPRAQQRRSSDVILGYERNPVFVEIVSGPLQAGTITQGDLKCFEADADRLVVKKAKQLDHSIRDFFAGDLELPGIDRATVSHVWPVIVTSHAFPHMELIVDVLERRLRDAGYLQQERVGRLAMVSAEELFFCEGFMQQGKSFLALIRGWKSGSRANLPLKNYLIELGHGHAPGSKHFELRFAEANAENMRRMLAKEVSAESMLEGLRRSNPAQ